MRQARSGTYVTGGFMRALLIAAVTLATAQCGDADPAGLSQESCAGGSGARVPFCRQVENYVAGFGVPGEDVIRVSCLVGPAGATVSNSTNGTYSCGGTYKLTTFPTAEISLNWGGSTSYEAYQTAAVTRGEGSFSVMVEKISGGDGNLFLSMSSGSSWMFDVVLVNTQCTESADVMANVAVVAIPRPAGASDSLRTGRIERFVPRTYPHVID